MRRTRVKMDLGRVALADECVPFAHGELHALGSAETRATLLDGEHAPSAGLAIEHEVRTAHLREHAVETALLREALGLDHQHQGLGTECANERARHLPEPRLVHDLGGDRGEGVDDHQIDFGRLATQRFDQRLDALRTHQRRRARIEFEQHQALFRERGVEREAERVCLVHQRLGRLARDDLHHFAALERAVGELRSEDGTATAADPRSRAAIRADIRPERDR
jgi:hypothetical protein